MSGDNGSKDYNEPKMILEDLIVRGIPKTNIILDYAGFSTIESIQRYKYVFQESKILVISQKFQNERAIYIGDHFKMKIEAYNCQDVSKYYGFKTNVREFFARFKMMLDLIFNVKPTFLGDPIRIEKSSNEHKCYLIK